MSSHATYALLSGAMVAGAWLVLDPLQLGQAPAAGAGFALGSVAYLGIAVLHGGS